MTSSHLAILNRPRTGAAAVSIAAGLAAGFGFAAFALGITMVIARADNSGDAPQPASANVQRASQTLPPARVILPAPWEQAAPVQPVAAPAKPADRQ
ncbi:hypothetical protein FBZ93_108289 [Bradyrhizobium macuxiense]|uniref:Uncharacterized protein n=1 Tax=Bradyrhizobium macuxiense TaxID=1755647 RepID=A0A560LLF8_9BRAD|nr:hypothetical protein [Bradyrhizobium macuxiense]TWB96247.1 hypothetical protein FBZ93_108289 [Bradyrhizobium macuxiense]